MSLELSFVVVTDTFATIRDVVRAVRAQSISPAIELVIVCRSGAELELDPRETAGIGAVRVVEAEAIMPLSPARAAGVRAASCPLVFIGETHSYPAPDCLQALLAAHAGGDYAVVMPVIENGNPTKALSWALLMLTYRHWIDPAVRTEIETIATYNGCFRRQALVDLGERLAEMLDYGSGLDALLRDRGGRFLIEPAARLAHLNVATFRGWLPERFLTGRFWGTARSRGWSASRRLLYFLATPIAAVLIAGKPLRSVQWAYQKSRAPAGTLALILLSAMVTAAGEATGYLAGGGKAALQLAEYEVHRSRYI